MSDSNRSSISDLIVRININGTVATYDDTGRIIEELSGNLPILHKCVELMNLDVRKSWHRNNYGEFKSFNLYFVLSNYRISVTTDSNVITEGVDSVIPFPVVRSFVQYIKKR